MALADRLRTEPIAGVYPSPYPRALQTVEPLAAALAVGGVQMPMVHPVDLGRHEY